jgi:hypothetical protein
MGYPVDIFRGLPHFFRKKFGYQGGFIPNYFQTIHLSS